MQPTNRTELVYNAIKRLADSKQIVIARSGEIQKTIGTQISVSAVTSEILDLERAGRLLTIEAATERQPAIFALVDPEQNLLDVFDRALEHESVRTRRRNHREPNNRMTLEPSPSRVNHIILAKAHRERRMIRKNLTEVDALIEELSESYGDKSKAVTRIEGIRTRTNDDRLFVQAIYITLEKMPKYPLAYLEAVIKTLEGNPDGTRNQKACEGPKIPFKYIRMLRDRNVQDQLETKFGIQIIDMSKTR